MYYTKGTRCYKTISYNIQMSNMEECVLICVTHKSMCYKDLEMHMILKEEGEERKGGFRLG